MAPPPDPAALAAHQRLFVAADNGDVPAFKALLTPASVAATISQRLTIPTVGIGAGVGCDAQVQVINDMLGLTTDFVPKHAKRYATLGDAMREAVATYAAEVQAGTFPTDKESFLTEDSILKDIPQA